MCTENKAVPKVSIVCAWYNRADYIKDTVDSLLNQDFDDYEIIISNDGSTDPRVKKILDSYSDPKLTIIHKENEGFTKTLKMLMEKSRAPFVAIQGAGDLSYANRLRKQYEVLSNDENVGAVGSGFDVGIEGMKKIKYRPPIDTSKVEELKKNVPFTHGTIMYRKYSYLQAGGYDTRFKYCSDWDLYFRILSVCEIKAIDEPLYKKIEFNDGFSFSPVHKFSQDLYKEAAINRSSDREKVVDSLDLRAKQIKPYQPYYLYQSARYAASLLKRRNFRKSFMWFRYFSSSFFQLHKNILGK
ncbi:hypothetical protein HVA01_33050 [Halovibrio variabilis]|uniref:Glycosyltransferase 2-like domain-containing protein n=1 Tax=Halovibrio variabilis TaxID=31910 RepID=A0A511USU0_9GAMM|nr:glycosyltransferase [Halovibrio variabilis]GEN29659.1 hypothetical protein HVA01_33050 [Halovibrio variabilis]